MDWISVSERLPNKEMGDRFYILYLVSNPVRGSVIVVSAVGHFYHEHEPGDQWRDFRNLKRKRINVTHWCPFPRELFDPSVRFQGELPHNTQLYIRGENFGKH